jgi:2'-5' RNA ligase
MDRPERLFIAVQLTEDTRRKIASGLGQLPGRIAPPENLHFTLRFLGNTSVQDREALVSAIRRTNLGRVFAIRFGSLGAFPRAQRARVLWIGISDGATQLVALAEKIEKAVRQAGFPAESRPFQPHLTLSRIDPPRSVNDLVTEQKSLTVSMKVSEVTLVRSSLGGGPARYEIVEAFPLSV